MQVCTNSSETHFLSSSRHCATAAIVRPECSTAHARLMNPNYVYFITAPCKLMFSLWFHPELIELQGMWAWHRHVSSTSCCYNHIYCVVVIQAIFYELSSYIMLTLWFHFSKCSEVLVQCSCVFHCYWTPVLFIHICTFTVDNTDKWV